MKTFKDLSFNICTEGGFINGVAELDFKNGYTISVITGSYGLGEYEVLIIDTDNNEMACDIFGEEWPQGFNTKEEVTNVMKKVQKIKPLIPNAETIEAMESARKGEGKTFNSIEELMEDLHSELESKQTEEMK